MAYQYGIDPVSLLLLRMLFALPFYALIWGLNAKKWRENKLSKKDSLSLIILGLLGYYLASYFDFLGLTLITASLERLILFSYPTIVLFLSFVFLKKRITNAQIVSILITYLGIAIIFFDRGGIATGSTSDLIKGSIFVLISAFCYASYLVGSSSIITRLGTARLTSISMIVSCMAIIVHYLLTSEHSLFNYQWQVYALSFLMALIATVIPSFLINDAIRRIGASNVSIVGSLGPVSTILLSMVFLDEMLTPIQLVGALIIISGIGVISRSKTSA